MSGAHPDRATTARASGRRLAVSLLVLAFAATCASASARPASDAAWTVGATVQTLGTSGEELFAGNISSCDTSDGGADDKAAESVLSGGLMPDANWRTVSVSYSLAGSDVSWSAAGPIEILVVKQGAGGVAYRLSPPASSGTHTSKKADGSVSDGVSHVVGCARSETPPAPEQGRLVVVKRFGGDYVPPNTAPSDFAFAVDGGQPVPFGADGEVTVEVAAGTYSVAEVDARGASVEYAPDGCRELAVAAGGSATCTITNTFQPPPPPPVGQGAIVVAKRFVGGAREVTLFVDDDEDPTTTPLFEHATAADHTSDALAVDPGVYAVGELVTEADDTVYDTTIDCAGATAAPSPAGDAEAMTVEVAAGQLVLCTITNTFTGTSTPPPPPPPAPPAPPVPPAPPAPTPTPPTPTPAPTPSPTPPPPTAPPAPAPPAAGPDTPAPPAFTPPVLTPPSPPAEPTRGPAAKGPVCFALRNAGRLTVPRGSRTLVSFRVTRRGAPAARVAVVLKGAGVHRVLTTNGRGVARAWITAPRAGIVTASIGGPRAGCNVARIGVLGGFEPPVTG